MELEEFDAQPRGAASRQSVDGNFLSSFGNFLSSNIADIFEDLGAPPHMQSQQRQQRAAVAATGASGKLRSSSCPRGVRAAPQAQAGEQLSNWNDRWDSPGGGGRGSSASSSSIQTPTRRGQHASSHSLRTSPDGRPAPAHGVLDLFANIGQKATQFLNDLDANFEQIFYDDDRPDQPRAPGAASPGSSRTAAGAQAGGAPGAGGGRAATGARTGAAGRGGRGAGKGSKLGASRLLAAASPAKLAAAARAGAASSPAHKQLQHQQAIEAASRGPRTSAEDSDDRWPRQPDQQAAQSVEPAFEASQTSPERDQVAIAESMIDSWTLHVAEAAARKLQEAEAIGAAPSAGSSEAPALALGLPAMAAVEAPGAAAAAEPRGCDSGVASVASSEHGSSSARGAPVAGGTAAAAAAEKRRCLKALLQEVKSLRAEKQSLCSQLDDMQLQNAVLVSENGKLRAGGGGDPLLDEAVRRQMERLLEERTRLAEENNRLISRNQSLHQLLAFTTEHSKAGDSKPHSPAGPPPMPGSAAGKLYHRQALLAHLQQLMSPGAGLQTAATAATATAGVAGGPAAAVASDAAAAADAEGRYSVLCRGLTRILSYEDDDDLAQVDRYYSSLISSTPPMRPWDPDAPVVTPRDGADAAAIAAATEAPLLLPLVAAAAAAAAAGFEPSSGQLSVALGAAAPRLGSTPSGTPAAASAPVAQEEGEVIRVSGAHETEEGDCASAVQQDSPSPPLPQTAADAASPAGEGEETVIEAEGDVFEVQQGEEAVVEAGDAGVEVEQAAGETKEVEQAGDEISPSTLPAAAPDSKAGGASAGPPEGTAAEEGTLGGSAAERGIEEVDTSMARDAEGEAADEDASSSHSGLIGAEAAEQFQAASHAAAALVEAAEQSPAADAAPAMVDLAEQPESADAFGQEGMCTGRPAAATEAKAYSSCAADQHEDNDAAPATSSAQAVAVGEAAEGAQTQVQGSPILAPPKAAAQSEKKHKSKSKGRKG